MWEQSTRTRGEVFLKAETKLKKAMFYIVSTLILCSILVNLGY